MISYDRENIVEENILDHVIDFDFRPNVSLRNGVKTNVKFISGLGELIILSTFISYSNKKFFGCSFNNTDDFLKSEILERENSMLKNQVESFFEKLEKMRHDVRTPLSTIKGVAYLLKTQVTSPELKYQVKILNQSIDSIDDMVGGIIGEYSDNNIPINHTIEEIFSRLDLMFANQLAERNIKIQFEIDKELKLRECKNQKAIQRIFMNLISNAINHSSPSLIQAGIFRKEGLLVGYVSDDGTGIPNTIRNNIFEKGTTEKTSKEGHGLGLWICKDLVNTLGGDIKLLNNENSGVRFEFKFPERELEKRMDLETSNFDLKILIVDDNNFNAEVLEKILRNVGCTTTIANSGERALDIVSEEIDLIFLDIQMPGIDGFETLERLLKLGIKAPVIALTGRALEGEKFKYISLGFYESIPKPMEPKLILDAVDEIEKSINITEELFSRIYNYPIIESSVVNKLEKYANMDILEEVFNEFCTDSENLMKKVNSYYLSKKYTKILYILHTLRGNAGTLGIKRIEFCSAAIENLIRKSEYYRLGSHITTLNLLFNEFKGFRIKQNV